MTLSTERPFAGKIVVVTGGTRGVGEAIASLFAERGAKGVVICGRNAADGDAVASKLHAFGAAAEFVAADLAKPEDCRTVMARAKEVFGTVDCLVNAAGLTDRGTILDTSVELFDRMFAVNVRAPFLLMQDAIEMMLRDGKEGTIVNILSMSSHGGQPFLTAYSASKGALATLTRNVAFSTLRNRIRVNGLNLGWMDTPGEATIQSEFHHAPPDWLASAEARQPFGRLIKVDEVARTVAFLCGPESGLLTGALIDFDQQVLGAAESSPHPSAPLKLPEARP